MLIMCHPQLAYLLRLVWSCSEERSALDVALLCGSRPEHHERLSQARTGCVGPNWMSSLSERSTCLQMHALS